MSPISILIIIALVVILCSINNQYEKFWGGPRYCSNCGYNGPYKCTKCINCGWGVAQTGNGSCIPGDARGPYFASDIVSWNYGPRPYYRRPHYRRPHYRRPFYRRWYHHWF